MVKPRDGRDGRDGADGERGPAGKQGERGLRGEKGDAGADGVDAVLVPSMAQFFRDDVTRLTQRVDVRDLAGALLLTITPIRDDDDLMIAAQITPMETA